MIGETGKAEAKPLGRRRGRRRAERAKAVLKIKRAGRARRMKKVSRLEEKGNKPSQIAKKVGVSPTTVARDLKEVKKE
jgi:DNA invertase Pin-like site-specific DNA recombinase